MSSQIIEIKNIRYAGINNLGLKKNIIDGVSFIISGGEITSFLYREKAKLELLLKIIAGLIKPDSGEVSADKKIVYIPSEPSSLPWLNVKENILYNLSKIDNEKFQKIIQLVGLTGYEGHRPHNKSIGFRFRIAIARALMNDGNVLVLGNPFSNMDSLTKKECTVLIKKVNSNGVSIVFSTTNILDAIELADNNFVITSLGNIEKINIDNGAEENILKIKNIL